MGGINSFRSLYYLSSQDVATNTHTFASFYKEQPLRKLTCEKYLQVDTNKQDNETPNRHPERDSKSEDAPVGTPSSSKKVEILSDNEVMRDFVNGEVHTKELADRVCSQLQAQLLTVWDYTAIMII